MRYLHTMVRARDLDETLDFYCNKLGLVEVNRYASEAGRFTLVFLAAPDDIDSAQKGRLVRRVVAGFIDDGTQLESCGFFGGDRNAQRAAADPKHEIDLFGRNGFRRADEVAFILAVFVIDNNDHTALLKSVDRLLYTLQRHG